MILKQENRLEGILHRFKKALKFKYALIIRSFDIYFFFDGLILLSTILFIILIIGDLDTGSPIFR